MATTSTINYSSQPVKMPRKLFLLRWSFWTKVLFYGAVGFFIINVILMVSTVVIDSFAQSWFRTPLPPEYTTDWYTQLASDYNMTRLLVTPFSSPSLLPEFRC